MSKTSKDTQQSTSTTTDTTQSKVELTPVAAASKSPSDLPKVNVGSDGIQVNQQVSNDTTKQDGTADKVDLVNVESKEKAVLCVASRFASAMTIAEELPSDKLHLSNLITTVDSLLSVKKAGLTAGDFRQAAQHLISLVRSLGTLSDAVFIAAFPVILDLYEEGMADPDKMFTDSVTPFKIFTNNQDMRGLTNGHAKFITAVAALAPKETRAKVGKGIDLNTNFAALPDVKRTRIKDIFRKS